MNHELEVNQTLKANELMELNEQATVLFNSCTDLDSVTNRLDFHIKKVRSLVRKSKDTNVESIVKQKISPIALIVIYIEILIIVFFILYFVVRSLR